MFLDYGLVDGLVKHSSLLLELHHFSHLTDQRLFHSILLVGLAFDKLVLSLEILPNLHEVETFTICFDSGWTCKEISQNHVLHRIVAQKHVPSLVENL